MAMKDQGHGNHWKTVLGDESIVAKLHKIVQDSEVPSKKRIEVDFGTGMEEKDVFTLMCWTDECLVSFMTILVENNGFNELVSAYPFARCGTLFKGKIIDVGSSVNGILNPFHVMTSLSADEGSEGDSFAQHLQFLEEFFKTIFEGMSSDAFETVNALVTETYKRKNIDNKTDLSKLKPEDYPIFDDLYAVIQEKTEKEQDDYHRRNLQILLNYVQKFASGGRNSNLWNGPTSIVTKENFVCFNFRSLMVNRNMTIANAQMLLVFKYLDNEILKNRDFNKRYETLRKIIVAVDEAHMFINPKFPIALDFMAQMAKRIRKYEGMQIVITQNIKDFVGSADIERQATAVINASQYSMIFSLAPNDITDLVNLYRNAGEINSDEQDAIVTAGRGQCFFIASAFSRTTFMVEANDAIKKLAGLSSR